MMELHEQWLQPGTRSKVVGIRQDRSDSAYMPCWHVSERMLEIVRGNVVGSGYCVEVAAVGAGFVDGDDLDGAADDDGRLPSQALPVTVEGQRNETTLEQTTDRSIAAKNDTLDINRPDVIGIASLLSTSRKCLVCRQRQRS